MNLIAAMKWWYQRVDYERRPPKPGELSLERMRRLLERLGNPQHNFRSILIAGTNGKGSVSAMIDSIARQAGHRTALYTSPHLIDIEERVRVAGVLVGILRVV